MGRNIAWVVCYFLGGLQLLEHFPVNFLAAPKKNEVLLVMPCCRGIRNQVGGSDLMGLLGVDVFLGWVVFKNPLNP